MGRHLNQFLRIYGKERNEWQWDQSYEDHTVRYLDGIAAFVAGANAPAFVERPPFLGLGDQMLEQVDDSGCWSRWTQPAMATTNHVKGCIGALMTEDSRFHWRIKPRHL